MEKRGARGGAGLFRINKGGDSQDLSLLCDAVTSPSGQLASTPALIRLSALANKMLCVLMLQMTSSGSFTSGISLCCSPDGRGAVLCVGAQVPQMLPSHGLS